MRQRTWKPKKHGKKQVELPHVESEYEAWFDGACWPNPNGHAACGALVKRNGETIWTFCDYLGNEGTSNNVAEYAGLVAVLNYLHQNSVKSCVVYGDSNLVIKQMNKEWSAGTLDRKERNGKMPIRPRYYLQWFEMATEIQSKMTTILTFQWTPREKNIEADELSSQPLRERGIKNIYHYERPETDLEYVDRLFEQVVASAPTGDPNCPF